MSAYEGFSDPRNLGIREPADMFSPHHYSSVRHGDSDGGGTMRTLPLWCYTSERFHEAEIERIFLPSWTVLGREESVPEIGDFHCLTYLGAKLVMVRGKDGKVRVFANTCRHRGAVIAEGSGNCKGFRCPYHFWNYGLDGRLIVAPEYKDSDGNPLIDDDNRHEYGLAEVESGTWGGFVFVRFRGGGQTLEQDLGNFVDLLASHRLEDMRIARQVVYEMDANWKCFIENYMDLYHIPYVHKDSLALWNTTEYWSAEPKGQESLTFARHEGSQLLLPGDDYKGFPAMEQIDPDKKEGTFFTKLRPNFMMTMGNDGALVFQSDPVAAGKSRLTVTSLFPAAYFERDDFEELAENYYRRNAMVVVEDKDIALQQYAGLQSPMARIARLCEQERYLNDFANWIVDRVIGERDREARAAE